MADFENEVTEVSSASLSLNFSENNIKVRQSEDSKGYGIRVLKDKKLGFAFCQSEGGIKKALDDATMLSRFSPQSGFSFPEKASYEKIDMCDRKIKNLDVSECRGMLNQIVDRIKAKKANARVYFSLGIESDRLENSAGFNGSYEKTAVSVYSEATIGKGYGYSYFSSIKMPDDFSFLGEEAATMAVEMQKPKKPQNKEHTVVFEPEALQSILEVLLPSFSGDWKRRKMTKLDGMTGKKIFSEQLSIYDNGLVEASETRPFDGEGTPTKRVALVENGVLKTFMYDRETAAIEGVSEKGFCSRGDYDQPPGIGNSNIEISGGSIKSFDEELGEFLLVKSLHGTHTANTTTGEFGVEVNVALQIKNGKRTPMRGFMISDNIFNMLNRIENIETERHTYSDLISPRIAISGIKTVS